MLPYAVLRKRHSFLAIRQAGSSWVTPAFALQYSPVSPEPVQAKTRISVGFTATKKTFRFAVQRNRAKRRLREAVRLSALELAVPEGSAIVLIARKDGLTMPLPELIKNLKWACRRVVEKHEMGLADEASDA